MHYTQQPNENMYDSVLLHGTAIIQDDLRILPASWYAVISAWEILLPIPRVLPASMSFLSYENVAYTSM